ncbi:L-ascorbate metabolism protein UlaG (beta-lactamase superfamily) [Marinilabilia salmonicolor]|jgi:L-ascorbate metabolism protein UlaG (beta-lactamase superfamily)|uniref:L-ascorbate metabolism protein UlaG (Beta-lactamase superfamily) n=2 Tax=Marinilabilia salmonicolor TaxID=989 RepID=A0A2T0XH99_9BACT|nr:L-ascorbate metabolism protein UlaG (beta-lactamase superfamily) [Marinilabilia salmonicolor]RCW33851.1 L-ascorbate metabolism protein UlaG (beta-lactamase superfamily) [Marinilabilia salmonicolor]
MFDRTENNNTKTNYILSIMRKIFKVALWVLIVLLIFAGGIALYVKDQLGSIDSLEERNVKYGGLNYYSTETGEFISPEKLPHYPERTTGGDPGFSRFFKTSPYAPETPFPKKMLTKNEFSKTPADFATYWFGHSTVILELDGKRILFDPVFKNAGPLPIITRRYDISPLKREELPKIDLVIITHDHYDHLETATIKYLADKGIEFLVPLGVGARLEGWGVPKKNITELGWEQEMIFDSITITALPGIHYSGRSNSDRNQTLWASYAIKGKEKNIFNSGDTGYGKHLKGIGEKYGPFDLAFVEIDGWNNGWPLTHLFPDQVIQLCKDMNTKLLFPTHWGTFDLALHPWNESIQMVADRAAENDIEMVTPILGEKVIPGVTPTSNWWITLSGK